MENKENVQKNNYKKARNNDLSGFSYNINIGNMVISKGHTRKAVDLYVWDVVDKCTGKKCLCKKYCPYMMKVGKKCKVQVNYLASAMKVCFDCYGDDLDSTQLYNIGMHMIPLYKILCKLKMRELSLNDTDYNVKGMRVINPLYREIRNTIRDLVSIWRDLADDVGKHRVTGKVLDYAIDLDFGSDGFYKNMKETKESITYQDGSNQDNLGQDGSNQNDSDKDNFDKDDSD